MSQWELHDVERSDLRLVFQYQPNTGLTLGVSIIQWDLGAVHPDGTITLGDYTPQHSGNFLAFVRIRISTNSFITWCTYSQQLSPGCGSNTWALSSTMAHELGHSLGLDHPVTGPQAATVMECITDPGEVAFVQVDDVSGERYLYGGGPSGTPVNPPC